MTIIARKSGSKRLLGAMTALALCLGLSACSGKSDGDAHAGDTMQGVSASGKLGSKPDISFKTPFKVENQAHQVIQEGNGEVIRDGDRVCTRSLALDAKTGKVLNSTWDKSSPECSIVISKKSIPAYYDTFKGLKVNSSWDRGQPSDFSLDQVVKGWQQGLAGQTVGSQVLLVIPPDLGYGSQKQQSIPANSTLIFVVDILAAY